MTTLPPAPPLTREEIAEARRLARDLREKADAHPTMVARLTFDWQCADWLERLLAAAEREEEWQQKYECNTAIMHARTEAMYKYQAKAEKLAERLAECERQVADLDPNFKRTGFRLWGWFEDAGADAAVYEPPHDAPCPYCFAPITADDVRTVSLMWADSQYAKRSYFYRAHRTCANAAADAGKPDEMDGRILDAIQRAGD